MNDSKINKEIALINKRLLYDFLDENKFQVYSYIFLILFSYPLNSIVISNFFSDLVQSFDKKIMTKQVQFYQKNYLNTSKGILSKIIFLLFFTSIITQFIHETEKKLFPKYIFYLNTILRKGMIQSRMENFEEINVGEMIMRISDVVYDFESLLKESVNKLLPFLLKVFVVNVYYAYYNFNFSVFNMVLDVIRLYLFASFSNLYKESAYKKFDSFFENSRKFSSTFENIFHIVINNELASEMERQEVLSEKLKEKVRNQMDEKRNFIKLISIFSLCAFVLKFYFFYDLYKKQKVSKKVFIIFLFLESGYINEWKDISFSYLNMLNTYEGIRNGSSDLYKILVEEDRKPLHFLPIQNGEIVFENVAFCYDHLQKKCIFNNANYVFSSGQKYILEGQSGSGKSSLIHLILKLIPVTSGSLTINNFSIETIPTEQIREIITMIPQKNSLFTGLSMEENLIYGTNSTTEDLILLLSKYPEMKSVLLQENSMSSFLNRVYDGTNASGGQKRIIINLRGVLRSKSFQSRIVILDEPLVGLNQEVVQETLTMIKTEFENQTVLLIEHLLKQNKNYISLLNSSNKKFKQVNMNEIY